MEKAKNKNAFFSSVKYEFVIFITLIAELLIKCPDASINDGCFSTTYLLSYQEFGFRSRMLLGSLIRLFTDYVTKKELFIFLLAGIILLCFIASLIVGHLIKTADGDKKKMLIAFTVLFLASPVSLSYLFSSAVYLDTYMILLAVLSVFFVSKKNAVFLVPLFTLIAILTHQSYVCLFMPAIGIAFLYEINEADKKLKDILILIVCCIIAIGFFFKFQFFKTPMPFENVDALIAHLSKQTEITIGRDMLFYEYFATMAEHLKYTDVYLTQSLFLELYTFIGMLPLTLIFIKLWFVAIKNSKDIMKKIIFILSMVSPLVTVPIFVLATDWGRWTSMIGISQFLLAFYFAYKQDAEFMFSAEKIKSFFEKYPVLFYVLIVWLAFYSFGDSSSFGTIKNSVVDLIS